MDNGALATAFVGVIAATAATYSAVITKDAKTSEFRQQWIDGLRDDISNLCAAAQEVFGIRKYVLPNVEGTHTDDIFQMVRDEPTIELAKMDRINPVKFKANQLAHRIRLRLDLKEKKRSFWARLFRVKVTEKVTSHNALVRAIDMLVVLSGTEHDDEVIAEVLKEVQVRSAVVLDAAWEHVKAGETRFRWALRIAVFSAIGAIVVLLIVAMWEWHMSNFVLPL